MLTVEEWVHESREIWRRDCVQIRNLGKCLAMYHLAKFWMQAVVTRDARTTVLPCIPTGEHSFDKFHQSCFAFSCGEKIDLRSS
ncbi:MAG: hypothetical protein A2051_10290 [Desulfovibrionales bacterium GWA2_65_9]|nr:MAG: hypothetical protein A2051_10290 [Desulfovibrionales bacterium GWA2_65_9]